MEDPPLFIRSASEDDARSLSHILKESRWHAYRALISEPTLRAMIEKFGEKEWRQKLLELPNDRHIDLAFRNDVPIAFVEYGPSIDGFEVFSIFVAPAHHRHGIGAKLLQRAEAHLQDSGAHDAVLWVLEANKPAQNFYKLQGWQHDGAARGEIFGSEKLNEIQYRKKLIA